MPNFSESFDDVVAARRRDISRAMGRPPPNPERDAYMQKVFETFGTTGGNRRFGDTLPNQIAPEEIERWRQEAADEAARPPEVSTSPDFPHLNPQNPLMQEYLPLKELVDRGGATPMMQDRLRQLTDHIVDAEDRMYADSERQFDVAPGGPETAGPLINRLLDIFGAGTPSGGQ